jgi:nitrate/TMAO reductase-like tetraheme cytochrome c subunit
MSAVQQGDFGINQKGTEYGIDDGDGIITAEELQAHYDKLAAAEKKRAAEDAVNQARLQATWDKMDQTSEASRMEPKDRGTHMNQVASRHRAVEHHHESNGIVYLCLALSVHQ